MISLLPFIDEVDVILQRAAVTRSDALEFPEFLAVEPSLVELAGLPTGSAHLLDASKSVVCTLAFPVLAQINAVQLGPPLHELPEPREVRHVRFRRPAVLDAGTVETLILCTIEPMPLLRGAM
jgi:hypothetical protein